MIGQWLGRYQGNMPGDIIVDIDQVENEWHGYGLLRPDEARAPIAFARFVTEAGPSIKTTVPVFCLDPRTSTFVTWTDIAQLFPDFTLPTSVEFSAEVVGDTLKTEWQTPIGSAGSAQIGKSKAGEPSQIKPIALSSWAEFKAFVMEASPYEFIFRGHQRNDWRLRTSFHRTGHANLERYNLLALNTVSRHLSGLTSHYFHTADPLQNGAFVTLIQHHGFPTPLLDWTFSPYVAAFFAFSKISKQTVAAASEIDCVRIYRFSNRAWRRVPQVLHLSPVPPHFSILEALAMENKRLIPQQGLSTVTNVDDIETYIQAVEKAHDKQYLIAIDLPIKQRPEVMGELALMGVTAGTLFPGLDGACDELRERFFGL